MFIIIAFQSSSGGNFEIYTVDVEDALRGGGGSGPRRLTENRAVDLWPSWAAAPHRASYPGQTPPDRPRRFLPRGLSLWKRGLFSRAGVVRSYTRKGREVCPLATKRLYCFGLPRLWPLAVDRSSPQPPLCPPRLPRSPLRQPAPNCRPGRPPRCCLQRPR
jgi:hypothetical protein